jgi:hypothetical protein
MLISEMTVRNVEVLWGKFNAVGAVHRNVQVKRFVCRSLVLVNFIIRAEVFEGEQQQKFFREIFIIACVLSFHIHSNRLNPPLFNQGPYPCAL